MKEGLWMVFDHYLTVKTWNPDFISPAEKTKPWYGYVIMNLVYYDESILLALASAVGHPIKVDNNMKDFRRDHFACVCIDVDLTKPVVGRVWLHGF